MNKILLIGGAIAVYFLFIKKPAAPAAPAAPGTPGTPGTPGVPMPTPGSPAVIPEAVASMTSAQLDEYIDDWMRAHPDEPLPEWLMEKGIKMGVIY